MAYDVIHGLLIISMYLFFIQIETKSPVKQTNVNGRKDECLVVSPEHHPGPIVTMDTETFNQSKHSWLHVALVIDRLFCFLYFLVVLSILFFLVIQYLQLSGR